MKPFFSFLALLCFCTLNLFAGEPLPIGSAIPHSDLKMTDIDGKSVSILDAAKKNGVLVIFSCNTCPYVIKNEKRIRAISAYALKNNFGVIIINSNEAQRKDVDSYEAMKAYANKQKFKWHYVVDKNHVMADAFGATRTPECFLFNSDFKLVYHGAIDDSPADPASITREHLKMAIDETGDGKPVSVNTSKSVGCTIKRIKAGA